MPDASDILLGYKNSSPTLPDRFRPGYNPGGGQGGRRDSDGKTRRGRAQFQDRLWEYGGVSPISGEVSGGQSRLLQMLQDQAAGQGPGQALARANVADQVNQGLQAQRAQAASASPANAALAARQSAIQSGRISGAGVQARAQAGLAAQLGAQNSLQGLLAGMGGQNLQERNLLQQLLQMEQAGIEAGKGPGAKERMAMAGLGLLPSLIPGGGE